MTEFLNPPELGDFTSAGLSSGAATEVFVYAAGLALDPNTLRRRADADTVGAETRICLRNIKAILAGTGLTLRHVVKTTCYLSNEAHRGEFIAAYREVFDPGPYPARCTFVLGLAADLRVQIEAVAVRNLDAD